MRIKSEHVAHLVERGGTKLDAALNTFDAMSFFGYDLLLKFLASS